MLGVPPKAVLLYSETHSATLNCHYILMLEETFKQMIFKYLLICNAQLSLLIHAVTLLITPLALFHVRSLFPVGLSLTRMMEC